VPTLFPGGWAALRDLDPTAAEFGLALSADPTPLARAMADGPHTLVHGDWKFGNLGTLHDGRTVLLDWAWPGEASPCVDLAWYLGVNCDRLPESKEDTIDAYRTALERRGITTAPWWDRHLELALLGNFLQLAWSKTGNPTELAWWTDRVLTTKL
jgi:thiamine kinase-like enzyme